MSLSVEPNTAAFPSSGGVVSLNLTNNSGETLAFKVKSSNNALFTVTPVFGLVGPSESAAVQVTCKGPITKSEKKVIQYANANGATDPQSVFVGKSNLESFTVQCVDQSTAPAPAAMFEQNPNAALTEGAVPEQFPQDQNPNDNLE
ncbi:unnamed protein product [Auanema sp. JU1783]|nr:unnamed protein product [Auanema sp. JU1783]